MKFIDEASIHVKAGKGGAGSRHFRREKFVPLGGPDGGNGGAGGSIIVRADRNRNTLIDFQYRYHWEAQDGKPGGGACKDGKAGEDLVIHVPVGTQIFREEDNELVGDLAEDGQELILAKAGRGGKGNTFFKSATNQTPQHAQPGEEGESGTYRFSLKLVADVGLVGFPNAGKSTLISRISASRPKIADYPFTTLEPNLGVVRAKGGRSFVTADIPGLLPGAHLGKGLGIKFLKHIERTRILAHLIDPTMDKDLLESFEHITAELQAFSLELAQKKQIVVVTKMDAINDFEKIEKFESEMRDRALSTLRISSVRGDGIDELINFLADLLGQEASESAEPGSVTK